MTRRETLLLMGALATSAKAAEPRAERASYNPFTDEEEVIIGRRVAEYYEKKTKLLRNPLLDDYLQEMVDRLAQNSQRRDVRYRVLVTADRTINATSIAGGHLYVNLGLLRAVKKESQLVGVLSHEVGHVVGRHMMNRIAREQGVISLVQRARRQGIIRDDDLAERIAREAAQAIFLLFERAYSREEEREADLFGIYQATRAGWEPRGLLEFFEVLKTMERPDNPVSRALSTHPPTAERIALVRRELNQMDLPLSLREDSVAFQAMKVGLELLG